MSSMSPTPTQPEPIARLTAEQQAQQQLVDLINGSRNLYEVLGVERWADGAEMRRSYMQRCRSVHPDKFPEGHDCATTAFQKLSYAYSVLSKPASKRQYDSSPSSLYSSMEGTPVNPFNFSWQGEDGDQAVADTNAQETFTQVLLSIWTDFIDGDFQVIRVIISGLNLGPDTVESMEGVFRRLRDLMLSGGRYTRVVSDELIRLYEIQQALRALRWLDLRGRMRLGLQLTRVVVSVPLKIDQVMQDEAEDEFVAEQKRIFTRESATAIKEEEVGPDGQPRSPTGSSTSTSSGGGGAAAAGDSPSAAAPRVLRPPGAGARHHRRRTSAIGWKPPDESAIAQRRAKAGLLGSKLHATLSLTASALEKGENWLGGGEPIKA